MTAGAGLAADATALAGEASMGTAATDAMAAAAVAGVSTAVSNFIVNGINNGGNLGWNYGDSLLFSPGITVTVYFSRLELR